MLTERVRINRDRARSKPHICLERASVYTRIYKETEGQPMILRRARAFREHCETKPIIIREGELIVGQVGCGKHGVREAVICPELHSYWFSKELETVATRSQDPYDITEDEKRIWREDLEPYWRAKTIIENWLAQVAEDTKELSHDTNIVDCLLRAETGSGFVTPGLEEIVFKKGLEGIKKDAQERLKLIDMTNPDDIDKAHFLKAASYCCDGMIALSKRYSTLAEQMALEEKDPKRRTELERIAEICQWVPGNPPRNFWEAVQTVWFVYMGIEIEAIADSVAIGRFDQFTYPYYEKETREARLTKEEALELVECFFIKLYEHVWTQSHGSAYYFSGYHAFINLTIGGVTAEGKDGTNDLSYFCMQAIMDLRLSQPSLAVRLHKQTPEEFLLKACELAREGMGFPAFHNDECAIPLMLNKGVSPSEARNWNTLGCVEPHLAGKLHQWSATGNYNLASAVEFAIFDGLHMMSGKRLGLETGDPTTFETFEDFVEATKAQLGHLIRHCMISDLIIERSHRDLLPLPFLSSLVLDCVEKGKHLLEGGARYNIGPGFLAVGFADIVNSLASIKKLIYDDRTVTWEEMINALRNDWNGYDRLRQLCVNAPKWGNDDDYVDEIGREIADFIVKEHHKYRTLVGKYLMPAIYPVSSNVPMGKPVWTLPNARRSGEHLTDGMSPTPGTDMKGPTAVLNSLSKINHYDVDGATLLNMKFDPKILEGEEGLRRLSSLLRTFVDLKIYHVQFNVIATETLRDAQDHPEKYRNLLVRVAGYSAYFVELCREIQEDIIRRTLHTGF